MFLKLAPLSTRRDVAILGVIHRAVLGKGPKQLQRIFERHPVRDGERSRHNFRVKTVVNLFTKDVLLRSAYGSIAVYNALPPECVAPLSVTQFQRGLMGLLRRACEQRLSWAISETDYGDWTMLFRPRYFYAPIVQHPLFSL